MSEAPVPSFTAKIWKDTVGITFLTFLFFAGYVFLLDGNFSRLSLSKMVAGTAGFLLAYSFSLSTLGYYFNFLDSKVIYRKYLGLMGYFWALAYSIMLLIINPDRYLYGFFDNFWSADFIFGLLAMAILTAMAVISNNTALHTLGPSLWRRILRLGYLAFFLLVVRAVIIEGEEWQRWLVSGSGLPPVRFLLSVVALLVIFFHYSISFCEWRKKRQKPALPPTPPPSPLAMR